ncbi:MAG: hypothetical protein ACI4Q4_02000 [Oscillospiraceae bacterium]
MAFSKKKKEKIQSAEAKLTQLLSDINSDSRENSGRLICETECTMARIRSYSDFLYELRVKPVQTLCYYGAVVFFLLAAGAAWCREWVLTLIFGVICLVLATLPHNLRIQHFNKQADRMENSYNKTMNVEFTDSAVVVNSSEAVRKKQEIDENGSPLPRRSAVQNPQDSRETLHVEIPYERIVQAAECSHSFYLFPVDENKRSMETIICDKTQFLCGTPMQLRDMLARKCGKRFRIKTKKA